MRHPHTQDIHDCFHHANWQVTDEDEPPPVFRQLETLASSKYSPARPGEVLLAVQGDNFFRDVGPAPSTAPPPAPPPFPVRIKTPAAPPRGGNRHEDRHED
jgi:hypothetical protein